MVENIWFFVFASVGMSHIIVDGTIFNFLRDWLDVGEKPESRKDRVKKFFHGLMSCYQCSGFWSGMIVSLMMSVMGVPVLQVDGLCHLPLAFISGCATSIASLFVANCIFFLQAKQ